MTIGKWEQKDRIPLDVIGHAPQVSAWSLSDATGPLAWITFNGEHYEGHTKGASGEWEGYDTFATETRAKVAMLRVVAVDAERVAR